MTRHSILSELICVGDFVLMNETIERLRKKWTEVFQNKNLKVNLGKTKVMVSD